MFLRLLLYLIEVLVPRVSDLPAEREEHRAARDGCRTQQSPGSAPVSGALEGCVALPGVLEHPRSKE